MTYCLLFETQIRDRWLCRYCVFDLQGEMWDAVAGIISKRYLNNKREWGGEGVRMYSLRPIDSSTEL
jgi:hypothetical protein